MKISEHYRKMHRDCLELSRRLASHDRPAAFRQIELAKTCRFYFQQMRRIGD